MPIPYKPRGDGHELDTVPAISAHNLLVDALLQLDDLRQLVDIPISVFGGKELRESRLQPVLEVLRGDLLDILHGENPGRRGVLMRQTNGVLFDIETEGIPNFPDDITREWIDRTFDKIRTLEIFAQNDEVPKGTTIPQRRQHP